MEREIRVITLGESRVGKTSIIKRICYNYFSDCESSTIGCDCYSIQKDYSKKNLKLRLYFIDTTGQEKLINILPMNYIRDSQIVLLIFSDISTLVTLQKRQYYFYKENANIEKSKFIVVGNKTDTFGINKKDINELGEKFAEEIEAFYITCSAKSEDNIDNLLNHIVTETKRLIDEEDKNSNITDLNNTNKNNNSSTKPKRGIKLKRKIERKKCC